LNGLGVSIRFIETANRPIGIAFWPRNRAEGTVFFFKSYLRFRFQIRNPRQNNELRPKDGTHRVVRRTYGPKKHVQTTQTAQNSVSIEQKGPKQGDDVLTDH